MSKRTATRGYFAAWVVWFIALVAVLAMIRENSDTSAPSGGILLGYLVLTMAGIVMLVTWIGVLVKLATQQAWSWFVAVLVVHFFGLGIIGMAAYAIAGPEDIEVVIRPTSI